MVGLEILSYGEERESRKEGNFGGGVIEGEKRQADRLDWFVFLLAIIFECNCLSFRRDLLAEDPQSLPSSYSFCVSGSWGFVRA